MQRESWICNRLTRVGYAKQRHIRLYGEEMVLVSDSFAENDSFVVEAIIHKTGNRRRIHIPLMTVRVLEHELKIKEDVSHAA